MNQTPKKLRFAPSPNGELHLGHAYSALLNLKLARQLDAKLLLRIENIDTARCTVELEKQMLEDLEWIGFEWDGVPRRQSEHFDEHREVLEILNQQKLLFPSFLSRKQISHIVELAEKQGNSWQRDPDGAPVYPGIQHEPETLDNSETLQFLGKANLRLHMGAATRGLQQELFWLECDGQPENRPQHIPADPTAWGDVVLARKDTPTSYHLACVVDDFLQGVTHVVRGKDLYSATAVHRLLQELLGYEAPVYHHHDLINDVSGRKLSKSLRDLSLRKLRADGYKPTDIHEMISLNPD